MTPRPPSTLHGSSPTAPPTGPAHDLSVWYRLAAEGAAFVESTWDGSVVEQRMAENGSRAAQVSVSPIVRDGLHLLRHICSGHASILDVGCGGGHWREVMRAAPPPLNTWTYRGTEINAARVELCRRLHPKAEFHEASVHRLPWPDRTHDIVMASGVLQYIREWPEALAELARVARGYVAVLRLPVLKHHATRHAVQTARGETGAETHHFWLLSRSCWEEAASRAGLMLLVRDYTEEVARVEGLDERVFWLNYLFSVD